MYRYRYTNRHVDIFKIGRQIDTLREREIDRYINRQATRLIVISSDILHYLRIYRDTNYVIDK